MSIIDSILGFLLGFIIVYISVPPIIRVSIAKHLYDTPNERKASKVVVPTLGGVAIFLGFIISTIIATDGYNFSKLKYLVAAVNIMFFIGLKDDLIDLAAWKKLSVQIATATILIVFGNFRFTDLQGAFGIHEISYPVSFVLTLFTMIAIINAFNLIDGIDGLASGISIVISTVFGTWFLLSGHEEYAIMCFSLIGSLSGFFLFNVFGKKNKIFMGDSGSLILGATMVIMVIKFNEININQDLPYAIHAAPAVSIGILIVPIIDTLRVFFIRLSNRKSPFLPDMNHIHHNFLRLGFSHLSATSIIVFVNILFIGFTFAFHRSFNINNLMISIFTIGFALAYIPSLILKFNQSSKTANEQLEINNKKAKISSEPIFSSANISPIQSNLSYKKVVAKKDLEEKVIS